MKTQNFTFHVDLDERGEFRCHVENEKGLIVWTAVTDEDDGSFWPVEDGFMKHGRDLIGLANYLSHTIGKPINLKMGE